MPKTAVVKEAPRFVSAVLVKSDESPRFLCVRKVKMAGATVQIFDEDTAAQTFSTKPIIINTRDIAEIREAFTVVDALNDRTAEISKVIFQVSPIDGVEPTPMFIDASMDYVAEGLREAFSKGLANLDPLNYGDLFEEPLEKDVTEASTVDDAPATPPSKAVTIPRLDTVQTK